MFKKSNVVLSSILAAFILLLIPTVLSSTDNCGDVNNSGGEPDISDITRLIDYLYLSHTPLDCGTVEDIDGNVYQTVIIGTQLWMAENLKVTHYRNGEAIPNITDNSEWEGLTTGAYCNYYNDEHNVAIYGRLYNWYAVNDSRGLAPEGWHIPSSTEWQALVDYLGDSTVAGGKMKEAGYTHWHPPNTGATNESGFTALPGGNRTTASVGGYNNMGYNAIFWFSTEYSSSNAYSCYLPYNYSEFWRSTFKKFCGFSIRCVKD